LGALNMQAHSNDPEYWRSLAEEARAMGVQMLHPHTKTIMLGIAQTYEKIAQSCEKLAPQG
jgi:hypothetical protein